MHKNQGQILALSLATVFLFVVTQFGWPTWAEKRVCFQDIPLSIAIDLENGEPLLFFEVGLPPADYKTIPIVPVLPGKPFQGLIHLWSFMQVWNDNGSAFTIKFGHNGEKETLTRLEG